MANLNLNPLHFLSGYKTYILGVAMVIYGFYAGDAKIVMDGLGFIFLRQGIVKM